MRGIDHLSLHAVLLRERLRGPFGRERHTGDAHDRHVRALARDPRMAEVDRHLIVIGHLATDPVQRLVLDEDDGVLVADRGLQQALGVGGRGGNGDEQAGDVQEHRLQAVRMGWAELMACALGHADHQRHRHLAAEHVANVRRAVDDLVERQQREVDRHQLDDRSQSAHRRAHADSDDRVLRDRRVANTALVELLQQTVGDLERAAEHADVLAQQQHALVALQLLAQRRV